MFSQRLPLVKDPFEKYFEQYHQVKACNVYNTEHPVFLDTIITHTLVLGSVDIH